MKTKDEIKRLLTNDKRLRDSDSKLIARFWNNELERKGIDTKEITAYEFLCLFAESKIHNVEGITRMRRKVQEENKELRGSMYQARKTIMQKSMKAKLGYNVHMSCQVPRQHTLGSYDEY